MKTLYFQNVLFISSHETCDSGTTYKMCPLCDEDIGMKTNISFMFDKFSNIPTPLSNIAFSMLFWSPVGVCAPTYS